MKIFLVLFFLSSFASVGSLALAKTEIAFTGVTEVSDRGQLTWADLAEVKEGSVELFSELRKVPYTDGGIIEIREQMRELRGSSAVLAAADPKIIFSNEFRVKKVKGYSGAEFRRKMLNLLGTTCAECQFELKSVNDEGIHLTSEWSIDESAVKANGQLLVPLSCQGATAWVPVKVQIRRQGLAARHVVSFGQKLSFDDFEQKIVDVSNMRDVPATLKDLEGSVLSRTVSVGQVVARGDLRREDLVQRGQPVKVLTGDDLIEITTTAVSEQAGRQGDVVRVKATDSGRVLSAVVTGSAEVRLQ